MASNGTRSMELTPRLKKAGLWAEFTIRRGQFERDGLRRKDAYEKAASEFLPRLEAIESGKDIPAGAEWNKPLEAEEQGLSPKARILWNAAKGRKCTQADKAQWVSTHIDINWGQIAPESVPSQDAVSLLNWAKDNRKEFYQNYDAKMLNSKVQDGDARFRDDGRALTELCDRVSRLSKEAKEEVD